MGLREKLLNVVLLAGYVSAFVLDSPPSNVDCNTTQGFNNALNRFSAPDDCTSIYEVAVEIINNFRGDPMLVDDLLGQHECARELIRHLSDLYPIISDRSGCRCEGLPTLWHHSPYHFINNKGDDYECFHYDQSYSKVYNYFFTDVPSECQTHHNLWHTMRHIQDWQRHESCEFNLLLSLYDSYYKEGTSCTCFELTTTSTTASTPTPSSTTASQTFTFVKCNSVTLLTTIAYNTIVRHPSASLCLNRSQSSSEALILDQCNVGPASGWTRGYKVLDHCDSIPSYTPIATFSTEQYLSSNALTAVFIQCENNGFEIAAQECGHAPQILHISTTDLLTWDANSFYTIV